MSRPVVVTGLGAATPAGVGVDAMWRALVAGQPCLSREERVDTTGLPCAPVSGRIPRAELDRLTQEERHAGRNFGEVVIGEVIHEAMTQAGFEEPIAAPGAVVMSIGPAMTPETFAAYVDTTADFYRRIGVDLQAPVAPTRAEVIAAMRPRELGDPRGSRFVVREVSRRFTRPITVCGLETTCATGANLLTEAARQIERREAEVAVTAVISARLTPYIFGCYAQMQALSRWPGPPEQASRPFDEKRSGMVLAEAAACIVLESEEHAARRGKTPLARLAGWGFANGGSHPTAPDRQLIVAALRNALTRSGLSPADFDAVNTHGTSTRLNDRHEAAALHAVFGERVREMGFSACKSVLGHSSIAAGLVESAAAVKSVMHGVVVPVTTCTHPDADCDIPVRAQAWERPVRVVLKNAFGFGGVYGAVVFAQP